MSPWSRGAMECAPGAVPHSCPGALSVPARAVRATELATSGKGGLVPETWWDKCGTSEIRRASGRPGVVCVFSMDAPLNGLSTGSACGLEKVLGDRLIRTLGSICQVAHVSSRLGYYYAHLWASAPARDSEIEHLSASEHNMYVLIGSEYDPV